MSKLRYYREYMQLVIVESPSKAKTINKYLGKDYKVLASVGHVRDLPKSNKNAIDIDNGFTPHYEVLANKKKVISDIVTAAKKANSVLLATDLDREGEAIAWHLHEILQKNKITKPIKRITFNEITKNAVTEALKKPRDINQNLRHAQEARRVLDRLMGYELSGLIWKKVRYGLSAGRVQSPALRIIMQREREIRAFDPQEYYVLTALTKHAKKTDITLVCTEEPKSESEAKQIIAAAKKDNWHILDVKETSKQRRPKAPFTTSTLQQTASSRLGFAPARSMRAAQKLYEAGHITYMRTDSTHLAKQAVDAIATEITSVYGAKYVQITSHATKSKSAQEAHEAIRPTTIAEKEVQSLGNDEANLYRLIRARTLASQMVSAKIAQTRIIANTITNTIPNFTVSGSRIIEPGWLLADPKARGEDVLVPVVNPGDTLQLINIESEQKFTQPPNRYSEAGLIKELEKRGIGRPSTYASTIKTLIDRGYVEKESRSLHPTDTGDVVSSFLEEHFMEYIDDDFTAEMEDTLDKIAQGEAKYKASLENYYKPFHKHVVAKEDIAKLTNLGEADSKFKCPECDKQMIIKLGRTGKFLSCSTYPDCKGALTMEGKDLDEHIDLGIDPETNLHVFVMEGRFGPYVQLGESPEDKKAKKPKRASLPKDMKPESITLEEALHLLILPRELGVHPDDHEPIIANVGRFGPYVGHLRNFRSLKKDDDPYTVTLERALELLNQPKSLPKGVTLVKKLGSHPKTGKDILLLKSKSGMFIQKGLKRLYFDDKTKPEDITLKKALELT